MEFDVREAVPKFLLRDKNGYAIAMAIQAGMEYMLGRVDAGLAILHDVDEMPEWRLDEVAWETNCLYDYTAGIEAKREWIRNAWKNSLLHGTPAGVMQYIQPFFPEAKMEEWDEYGGEPYHFKIDLGEEWSPESELVLVNAIDKGKNVRSVLDEVSTGTSEGLEIGAESDWRTLFDLRCGMPWLRCGMWPR